MLLHLPPRAAAMCIRNFLPERHTHNVEMAESESLKQALSQLVCGIDPCVTLRAETLSRLGHPASIAKKWELKAWTRLAVSGRLDGDTKRRNRILAIAKVSTSPQKLEPRESQ